MMIQCEQRQLLSQGNGRKNLVALDELHSIFIQNVSHELRTSLTILQVYAELLRNGELGKLNREQEPAIAAIVAQIHELRTLVERIGILLAAQANATATIPLSLAEIAADVAQARLETAKKAGLTLAVNVEPDLPIVIGDPYQIHPVLDFLLDSAINFTSPGGQIELQVYTESNWVCLAVNDTSSGRAQEEVDPVFNPICEVGSSITPAYRGLGLEVVKTVVAGHDGQMMVTGQPDQGRCFVIKLPAVSPAPQREQPMSKNTAPWRILVVDDEINVALTIQDGLEKLPNCEVVVSTSGDRALQLFEQTPFDLLITDYRMPGTDGMMLSTRVRQLYPATRIIMITAYRSHLLHEQAVDNAIQHVLDKPVKLDQIRSVAWEALEKGVLDDSPPVERTVSKDS